MPSAGERLFDRMCRTASGWRLADFRRVYTGFGFELDEGANHINVVHPRYPHLRTQLARGRELPKGYCITARKLINELKRLEGGGEHGQDE